MREREWIKTVAAAVAVSLLKRSNFMSFNLVYYFSCGGGGLWRGSRVSRIWIDIRFIAVRSRGANKERG